jgi:hypothetical protein
MNDVLAVLVVLLALAVAAGAGAPLTALVLRVAARSADAGEPAPADDDPERTGGDGPTGPHAQEVLRGGTWIGVLERLAVAGCVVAGYPGGIAFVIAIKGLGRFPELRDHPGVSERFVIGTFASLLWAAGVGLAARALVA